ncbi:MAG: Rne/Rng family ribonuclease [Jatrophihabitantaceae bacterium]
MLEPDNHTTSENSASTTETPAPAKAPRKRAAKKAPAAAAETPSAPAETPSAAATEAPAARKRPARKAAAKLPATGTANESANETSAERPTATKQPADVAEKPARRRARKSTPPQAEQSPADAAPSDPAPSDQAPVDAPPDAPAKAPRKRTARKATANSDEAIGSGAAPVLAAPTAPAVLFVAPEETKAPAKRTRRVAKAPAGPPTADEPTPGRTDLAAVEDVEDKTADPDDVREAAVEEATGARRRRRRGRRGRGGNRPNGENGENEIGEDADGPDEDTAGSADEPADGESDAETGESTATRRRRRRRRTAGSNGEAETEDDPPNTVTHVRETREKSSDDDGVKGVKGSTRLEAKRQRRRDGRDTSRRRPPILTESEFLARREAVDRVMAVRQNGDRTQIAVLEDGILVEHYVTRASATSYVGNVYLGRVQNVLPSMEAAFIDISKGRNGVLYAGEVNWDAAGLEGKSRAIEHAMKSGDPVLVQVTKDPIGHKGARLTSQVSLPGRFLVYVPGGGMTGISRKLPDTERHRLKAILKKIVPEDAGVIIRTAAEGASEEDLTRDVDRLKAQWEAISAKAANTKSAPTLVHGEPDLAIRVVRDVFNEDFKRLVVQGESAWDTVSEYLGGVAPDLAERASRHVGTGDLFHELRVDEQLMKALDRKVWLPSGGSLVIDRTEAMTVIDVNTGKFVGTGGNLEQTVTRNNLEAAEEIVRQLRLRDVGGIVVIDFIDMVLESNRDLVLRRLTECLGRDRTKHQVAEVTSLGLVQMTRKRVGEGLIEAFSENCTVCNGRGVIIHSEPVDKPSSGSSDVEDERPKGKRKRGGSTATKKPVETPEEPPEAPETRERRLAAMAAIHKAAHPGEALPTELQIEAMAAALEGEPMLAGEPTDEPAPEPETAGEPVAPEPDAPEPDAPEPDAPEPEATQPEATESDRRELEAAAAPAARPRRRRAASRPAGPPAGVGAEQS